MVLYNVLFHIFEHGCNIGLSALTHASVNIKHEYCLGSNHIMYKILSHLSDFVKCR